MNTARNPTQEAALMFRCSSCKDCFAHDEVLRKCNYRSTKASATEWMQMIIPHEETNSEIPRKNQLTHVQVSQMQDYALSIHCSAPELQLLKYKSKWNGVDANANFALDKSSSQCVERFEQQHPLLTWLSSRKTVLPP